MRISSSRLTLALTAWLCRAFAGPIASFIAAALLIKGGHVQSYGASKGIISTDDSSNLTVQKLLRLNTDYTAAQNVSIEKQSAYDSIVHSNPAAVTSNDPLVLQLTQEEAKLQRMPAEREFSRKIAVVVGGGSGIGREVALLLAQRGAHILVADQNATRSSGC